LVLITLRSLKRHLRDDSVMLYLKERGCKAVELLKIGVTVGKLWLR